MNHDLNRRLAKEIEVPRKNERMFFDCLSAASFEKRASDLQVERSFCL